MNTPHSTRRSNRDRRSTRSLRLVAVLAVLSMLAAACGLKPEAEQAIGFTPGGSNEFVADGGFEGDVAQADGAGNPLVDGSTGTDPAAGTPDGTSSAAPGASGAGAAGSGAGTGAATTPGSTPGSAPGTAGTTGATAPRPGGTVTSPGATTPRAPSGSSGGTTTSGSNPSTPSGSGAPAPAPAPAPPADGGGGGGGEGGGGGGGGAATTGSDRTGVDAAGGSINIAVHAPVTGAAPLPVTSFEQARDLYFRYLLTQQPDIGGFTDINVSFADDRYQPSTAVQACRQLASSNFLLIGAGGTDQIQACGRFAESQGIPYFSAGVTEAGLAGLRNYFAFSMSYKAQGALLAQYVAANFPGKKVAAVITDTENFADAVSGWEAGVQATGLNYYKTLRHPKGDNSWYNTFANELNQNEVDIVYILTAPVDYIRFAQQGAEQGFAPQFVGVGVSMALNAVLGSGCPQVNGGIFFSPFPGLDWARQNEPAFFQAAGQFGTPQDDIALALWAQGKILAQLLERYEATFGSNDVTREDFRNLVETSAVESGIFPRLGYSPQNHFGANQVHVLQADCGSEEHKTLATFATGF